jgi:hypothetical protein
MRGLKLSLTRIESLLVLGLHEAVSMIPESELVVSEEVFDAGTHSAGGNDDDDEFRRHGEVARVMLWIGYEGFVWWQRVCIGVQKSSEE